MLVSFCTTYSVVAAPLTDLLSPKIFFHLSEFFQSVFESSKALLTNAPPLLAPAFDRPFKIAADASDASAVSVLQERDDHIDDDHPVSYFSKKFNRHQQVHSTSDSCPCFGPLAFQSLCQVFHWN